MLKSRTVKAMIIVIVLLFAKSAFYSFVQVKVAALKDGYALASGDPRIEVMGVAWDKTNLKVLVVSASWLDKSYLDSVVKVFEVWDRALESFGNSYGFKYLSAFSFKVKIASTPQPGYDIVVKFSGDIVEPGGEIGLARVEYYDGRISKVYITLYTRTTTGDLTALDVFNVALHEVGHALGLNHAESRYTEYGPELMYPIYSYPGIELRPSTLDVYALAEVYSWLKTGIFTPPRKTAVSLPPHIPYRMLLYYKVSVYTEYGTVIGGGWYLEGSLVNVSLLSTIEILGEGIRAVFNGWSGYVNSEKPSISFRIYEDVELHAKWRTQYYVNVTTLHSRVNVSSGWYDSGTVLYVSLLNTTVYVGSDIRYVFVGWRGDIESSNSTLEVVVDKPVFLVAEWRLEYRVEIYTDYSEPLNTSGWYPEGERLLIGVKEEVLDFGNGTRLALTGWKGTLNLEKPRAEIRVEQPLRFNAIWAREYLVRVFSKYTGGFEKWVLENQVFEVKLDAELVDEGNGTRRVFNYWIVGGKPVREYPLRVKVNEPLYIEAVWKTQYEVVLEAEDMEGDPLEAMLVVNGEEVESGLKTWLDEGEVEIAKILYRKTVETPNLLRFITGLKEYTKLVECKPVENRISVKGPGVYRVKLKVWKVEVGAVDVLGIPSPFYRVEVGDEEFIADLDGFLFRAELPEEVYEAEIYFLNLKVGKGEVVVDKSGVYLLKTPLSPYYVIVLLLLIIAYRVERRARRKYAEDFF